MRPPVQSAKDRRGCEVPDEVRGAGGAGVVNDPVERLSRVVSMGRFLIDNQTEVLALVAGDGRLTRRLVDALAGADEQVLLDLLGELRERCARTN